MDEINFYLLWWVSETLSKSLRMDDGIMSMLAILSSPFSLMATEPLVFLPRARIWTKYQ